MSSEQTFKSDAKYYSIIDGTFRVQVSPDHPEAVAREWETKDGKSGTKYERVVQALFGTIEGMEFHDGEFGTNLNVTLDKNEDDGKSPVISVGTATPYGESLLKVLPNLKPGIEYKFRPYNFKDKDTGDDVRGVSVDMRNEDGEFKSKVMGFYQDADKKPLNGYPTPEGDTSTFRSDDWKLFYLQARKHMIKYAEEHVLPKFSPAKPSAVEYPKDDIKPEDIPF